MPNWISKIVGGSVSKPIESVGKILDNLFTSKEEKLDFKEAIDRLHSMDERKLRNMQTEVNKLEANHRTIFVAGWRPFIGWVCGTALLYAFILRDLITWGMTIWAPEVQPPPALHMEQIMTVLMGMLGLGGMRTYEKYKGVAK